MTDILELVDGLRGTALEMYRFHLQRMQEEKELTYPSLWVNGFQEGASTARRQELAELRRMRKQVVKMLEEEEAWNEK